PLVGLFADALGGDEVERHRLQAMPHDILPRAAKLNLVILNCNNLGLEMPQQAAGLQLPFVGTPNLLVRPALLGSPAVVGHDHTLEYPLQGSGRIGRQPATRRGPLQGTVVRWEDAVCQFENISRDAVKGEL